MPMDPNRLRQVAEEATMRQAEAERRKEEERKRGAPERRRLKEADEDLAFERILQQVRDLIASSAKSGKRSCEPIWGLSHRHKSFFFNGDKNQENVSPSLLVHVYSIEAPEKYIGVDGYEF